MKLTRIAGLALLLFALSACHAVYVDEPIGETPLVLNPEDWDGVWLLDDEAFMVDVLDSENGLLRIAGIETSSDGELFVDAMTIHVRDGGTWILGSIGDPDGEDPGFLWAAAKLQGDHLLLFQPDHLKFSALVEAGTLPGRFEGDNVYLGPLEPEHVALILSDTHGFLFDIDDEIGVATRVTQ